MKHGSGVGWLVLAVSSTGLCASCEGDSAAIRILGASEGDAGNGAPSVYRFLKDRSILQQELAETWAALPYERIGLTRTDCLGGCPAYSLAFVRGSGEATRATAAYEGVANTEMQGAFEGTLSLRDYAQLCQLVDHLGFVDLEPAYRALWADDASATVLVNTEMGVLEVLDYGNQGPPELVALQLSIDGLSRSIKWESAAAK